eukprot:CAMPEP_0183353642 /NCGR_PEP_ID=MMETSP0164_2-20130417/34243_1 /TAXON_ID=221442 /ORGANISM="Coccolithus pelagicus ssp braarudi, Strain PLY182g" /LENGTH=89 /DNA_ID=CAMNT_0025526345 /DNA_START=60 /DNA_END=326 /DNA_ORIENTATION=+
MYMLPGAFCTCRLTALEKPHGYVSQKDEDKSTQRSACENALDSMTGIHRTNELPCTPALALGRVPDCRNPLVGCRASSTGRMPPPPPPP